MAVSISPLGTIAAIPWMVSVSDGWLPIACAPRDGTTVRLLGANGKLDEGHWYPYSSHVDAQYRLENGIPPDETGEFSTVHGEGPFTHWMPRSMASPTA